MRSVRLAAVVALAGAIVASACGGGTTPTAAPSGAISSEPYVLLSTQFNTVTEKEP